MSNFLGGASIAQSFFVDSLVGAFITSIDVCFWSIESSTPYPATIELRLMDNGIPSNSVIAKKVIPASTLLFSNDASLETKFTFDYPVYLEGNKEYCFVVKSDDYKLNLWTATMGRKNYITGDATSATGESITKNPFSGSFFRSENSRTWVAEPTTDAKFSINRANFTTSSGTALLKNQTPAFELQSPYSDTLYNPLSFGSGSTTISVRHPNHGFSTGNSVVLSGTGNFAGVPQAEVFGIAKTITRIDVDNYTITSTTPATGTLVTGNFVTATSRVIFGELILRPNDISPSTTRIGYSVSTKERGGSQSSLDVIEPNKALRYKTVRESAANNDETILVSASFTSSGGGFVSPVVDLMNTGVVAVANRVSPNITGNYNAQYVQKAITLKNAADSFLTYIDVNRPAGTSVEVYYKVAQDNVAGLPWILAAPVGAQQYAVDDTTYNEFTFQQAATLGEFFVIQIKIVFWSDNEALVPRVRNLRTITLKA